MRVLIGSILLLIFFKLASPHNIFAMVNPASVFCKDQGYKNEIRTARDGSQNGVCIFPNGKECEEWAFYNRSCGEYYRKNNTKKVIIGLVIFLAIAVVGFYFILIKGKK
ncbi:hypothetical protein A2W14_02620 [Candidatus Gottesmanbacteria bacterium RBG_16_37_8]|uniref:DUF333 domain-containing protein n=1 Tax=Candidatus Gottesmanbacteria bacterium RBG_16_37_8 TaxID=1798371 RepID=A0A1F5YS73_9BACT|nr:MAG: hypothetical protein A2W14_02620 [Candidatus Gottesmanbacteria bacterium RBG_16_37_8]